jgi:predicted metal-dependent peptidase
MLFEKPLYAHLLARCVKHYSKEIPTAAVAIGSQIHLLINPEWWGKLSADSRKGVLEHEVLHLVFFHPTRMGMHSDHQKSNIAADLIVNQLIDEKRLPEPDKIATLKTVKDKNRNPMPEDKDLDWYYSHLPDPIKITVTIMDSHDQWGKSQEQREGEGEGEGGKGTPNGGGSGGIQAVISGSGADKISNEMKESIIKEALKQAREACSQSYGNTPGEVLRWLDEILAKREKKLPYQQLIRRFVTKTMQGDIKYTKKRVSKRYHSRPGIKVGDRLRLLVGFDTSGSVSDYMIKDFVDQIYFLSKLGVDIWCTECDTQTYRKPYKFKRDIKAVFGGGGTELTPIIDALEQYKFDGLMIFTDGEIPEVTRPAPRPPVLWVIAPHGTRDDIPCKFGHRVYMPKREGRE